LSRTIKPSRLLAWCILIGTLAGCTRPQPYLSWSRLDKGLVIVLPGIEGRGPLNKAICQGLVDGGVDWAVELCDWTSALPMNYLVNLRDQARNRTKAEEIAAKVVRYKMAHPERPVVLVGQSGGGAIAAWVAEAMPPGEKIDGLVMLSAALSPEYALDGALANVKRGIISYHSSRDWFFLGVGTTISGTMDGEHSSSAGRLGFAVPSSPRRVKAYEKLYQIPWQREMALSGYSGTHITSGAREFVAAYVAPFVLAPMWDRNFVELVGKRRTDESLFLAPESPKPARPLRGSVTPSAAPSPATRPVRPDFGAPATKR
jgi:pimeloyl-ACP methyl ester carboxylesterase